MPDDQQPNTSPDGIDDPVATLVAGVRRFQDEVFPRRRERFQALAKTQSPRTLFITCSDSRIVPEMITQTEPGELFVCRNVGNIVPAHGDAPGDVAAVVEYAVVALGVSDIVVCGHSNCGAMAGLLRDPASLDALPSVRSWLRNAQAARTAVEADHPELAGDAKIQAVVEQNVRTQMQNLRTHPAVAAGVASGKLALHGWVYDIGSGAVTVHDAAQGKMVPIGGGAGKPRSAER